VQIKPGGRGDFIVKNGGQLLWDKKQIGDFPEDAVIVRELAKSGG
jgi:predicted Rdx family selenoprotein